MKKKIRIIILMLAMVTLTNNIGLAQCKIDNKYFKEGEELIFDLYFKYGIMDLRAGIAILKTELTKYQGQQVYKSAFITNSRGTARSVFPVDDTLTSYMTKEIVPLKFVKDAHEGKDYTREEIYYKYGSGKKVDIQTKRNKNQTFRFDEKLTSNGCIYDMLSVVYYARTLDYSSMKKGDTRSIEFVSGKNRMKMIIEHRGIDEIKANNKVAYKCVSLVLSLSSIATGTAKPEEAIEAMRVYLTNDSNRMPVRIEFKLKHGATRGILKSYKGNKHPVGK